MVILPSIRRKYMTRRDPGGKIPLGDAVIALDKDVWQYTGSAITPTPVVTLYGNLLTVNVDFTVGYTGNVEVGQGVVTVTGIGQYSGQRQKSFVIEAAPAPSGWDFDISKTTFIRESSVSFTDTHSLFESCGRVIRVEDQDGEEVSNIVTYHRYGDNDQPLMNVVFGPNLNVGNITFETGNVPAEARYSSYCEWIDGGGKILLRKGSEPSYYISMYSVSRPYDIHSDVSHIMDSASISNGFRGGRMQQGGFGFYFNIYDSVSVNPGVSANIIRYYRLKTPGDITSGFVVNTIEAGSFGHLFDDGDASLTYRNFIISNDGTVLLLLFNRKIIQYKMSTPWDLSSAGTYVSRIDPYVLTGNKGGNFSGIFINDNGTKMVLLSSYDRKFYEYELHK